MKCRVIFVLLQLTVMLSYSRFMPNQIPQSVFLATDQIGPNEKKITKQKKPKKQNEKTYIFQLHDYLTYIISPTI